MAGSWDFYSETADRRYRIVYNYHGDMKGCDTYGFTIADSGGQALIDDFADYVCMINPTPPHRLFYRYDPQTSIIHIASNYQDEEFFIDIPSRKALPWRCPACGTTYVRLGRRGGSFTFLGQEHPQYSPWLPVSEYIDVMGGYSTVVWKQREVLESLDCAVLGALGAAVKHSTTPAERCRQIDKWFQDNSGSLAYHSEQGR